MPATSLSGSSCWRCSASSASPVRCGGRSDARRARPWYWHFVDGVWIVVFTVVYVRGAMTARSGARPRSSCRRRPSWPMVAGLRCHSALRRSRDARAGVRRRARPHGGGRRRLVAAGPARAAASSTCRSRSTRRARRGRRPATRSVERLAPGEAGHRVRIPVEVQPISAGIKGGIVGGAAMAVVALAYGVIVQRSLWYPVNLLAAVAMPRDGARRRRPSFARST